MGKTFFIQVFTLITILFSAQLCANSIEDQGIEFEEPSKPIEKTTRHLEFENEYVRVWKTTIFPHHPLKMHRHECGRVIYGIEGGTLSRIEENGQEKELVIDAGKAYWYEADPKEELHGDTNRGEEPMVVLVVEVKAAKAR